MKTAIGLALDTYTADPNAAQQILDALDSGTRWQLALRFGEVSAICSHRIQASQLRRAGNRMAIEATVETNRCARLSPDGRGLAWLLSGGEATAYGACEYANCPIGRITIGASSAP